MKFTNRNARKISFSISMCIATSLVPVTAISKSTVVGGDVGLSHANGWSTLSDEDMAHLFGETATESTHFQIAMLAEEEMLSTKGKNPVVVVAAVATGAAFVAGGAVSVGTDLINGQSVNWNNAMAAATGSAWTTGSAVLMTASGVGPIATVTLSPLIGGVSGLATLNGLNSLSSSGGGGGAGNCNNCHGTR